MGLKDMSFNSAFYIDSEARGRDATMTINRLISESVKR